MSIKKQIGKVILAGAGPGDPDLITLKTIKYLQIADVVLVDRLVSEDILIAHCQSTVEIIHVGKQCSLGISTPQQTINELLVYYARQGYLVVRLKGGDVSIFSNILDELETLTENQIPYEIIPGVTASLGASAYAGIPLTARGYSTSVRFLTYFKASIISDQQWNELSNTDDTLVFYMSSKTLPNIIKNLTLRNIDPGKLLAVIEEATTTQQKVNICSLYEYDLKMADKDFASPSLIIIGKVVSLHELYAWKSEVAASEPYFKPVENTINESKMSA